MTSQGSGGKATALFHAYQAVTALIAPFAYRKVAAKLAAQGVSPQRQRERLGHASQPRPTLPSGAPLIWFHGASVGESLAAITLINRLAEKRSDARFLLTSGTATSAAVAEKRLPKGAIHQFAPLDAAGPVRRFLDHWRPDAGIFVESELWPVTLSAAHKRGTRLALVNARLSDRSVRSWQKRAATARFILSRFDLLLSQNDHMAQNLISLGADTARVQPGGNLKAGAAALPVDAAAVEALRSDVGARPVWIASSTHDGEEETILAAHRTLLDRFPDLCLVLIPRHPERSDKVAELIRDAELTFARRSKGEAITPRTQVYLADTLGELGLIYRLATIAFVGGSLVRHGGQNLREPARLHCAVLFGSHIENFASVADQLIAIGAGRKVSDDDGLKRAVSALLMEPDAAQAMAEAGKRLTGHGSTIVDAVVDTLAPQLAPLHDDAENALGGDDDAGT